MTTSDWLRAKELFHDALEFHGLERESFLATSCKGDPELRQEIESLIKADEVAEKLITPMSPTILIKALASDLDGPPAGTKIGAYILRRQLAKGGMGTVYEASRSEDFEQTVAIKLIRGGADAMELLRRFKGERQTLARLDHPGIARLLDGGMSDCGRPYLVMEYIDGLPIDSYCDQKCAGLEMRLLLFQKICAAVQAAHGNLIVHRDIKPSNILVDPAGNPRLLDFGIAKWLTPDRNLSDEATRAGPGPMTPEFASPEQVRGETITTATDVYSLGVLLYGLLAGRRPYKLRTQMPHEMERAICEEQPEKPSTALTRSQQGAEPAGDDEWPTPQKLASSRSTDPARLRKQLLGDLDAIVLKAIRKEPELRYISPDQFAEDIGRYLKGLPVIARRDTWSYRASRFAKRHRAALGSTVLGSLLVAFSISKVISSSKVAAKHANEVIRLMRVADLTNLEEYINEVERLWPATEENAPAMRAWLKKARSLGDQLEQHRGAITVLRKNALPYAEADRVADVESHPLRKQREEALVQQQVVQFRLDQEGNDMDHWRTQQSEVDAKITALTKQIESRRSWNFTDERDQWQHDKLMRLIAELEGFVALRDGLIARVEDRLDFAESVAQLSLVDFATEWNEAVDDIATHPDYGGLELTPQLGLVPLGQDPESGLWEFWHMQSGERPERDDDEQLVVNSEMGIVLILIPPGEFTMGAVRPAGFDQHEQPNFDPGANDNEMPLQEVQLGAFFLSKYEMTQGQWLRFTDSNPSLFAPDEVHGAMPNDLTHPVEAVTWNEARETLEQLRLTLPTEAQWEYATRAMTTTPWWTGAGPSWLEGVANIADITASEANAGWPSLTRRTPSFRDDYVGHAPVGTYEANPYGLHDVHGNVWEWCLDDFADYDLPIAEGTGERLHKGGERRVGRGGSFSDGPGSVRSAHRGAAEPNYRDNNLGVRPARAIDR
ncbi:MAG: serine/threonine protein kinase/formylglycine-generating enzyme required for sulfatase activity [Planctomycetota bacterium]|jgi:serine/threonine protein kinase/formylglycine-generating enzyme required for sulfatase activity